jgi:hypothetical protein
MPPPARTGRGYLLFRYGYKGGGHAAPSVSRRASATLPAWSRWHDFAGESAPGRDHDQLPGSGTDREGAGVRLLKDAQDVGDLLPVARSGPTPADHDPLTNIASCQPDL